MWRGSRGSFLCAIEERLDKDQAVDSPSDFLFPLREPAFSMEETILIHNIIGHNVVQGLCYPIIDGPVCCIKMGGHVIGITIMTCSLDLLNDHFKTKASFHLAGCHLDWENCFIVHWWLLTDPQSCMSTEAAV